jgi:PAS domain S-box-containing protein
MDKNKQPAKKKAVRSGAGISGSKRAGEALKESERLYRSLTECSSDAIFCVNEKGQYKFANQLFASTFGKSPEYFIGKTFWDIYPKEHADYRFEATKRVFQTGQSESIEIEVPLPDKTLFFYATANPIKDETGKVILVLTHAVDITERKKTEEALRESEERFRYVLENVQDAVWSADLSGQFEYLSPVMARIYGRSLEEMVDNPAFWIEAAYPEDQGTVRASREALIRDGHIELEYRIVLPDGKIRWILDRKTLILDPQGKSSQIAGIISDVTERKQSEQALQESEAGIRKKLNAILEPEGGIGSLELSDILDYQSIQLLMDDFYSLTGIGVAIVDTKGKILVATGWQDICTRFHRVHPETQKHCLESDITLTSDVAPGQVKLYKCKNNMWDVATPIYLGENHIGNIFYGQFFFADEAPDHDFFRRQAGQYGFDEQAYMAALNRAIRWDREKVELIMAFYARFATMISTLSYSAIKLARTLAENDRTLSALKDSEEQFSTSLENAPDGVYMNDLDGNFLYGNRRCEEIIGYRREELIGKNFLELNILPDNSLTRAAEILQDNINGKATGPDELELISKNGRRVPVEINTSIVQLAGKKVVLAFVRDITERQIAEEALRGSEEKYRSVVENSMEAIVIAENGVIKFGNRQASALTGYAQEEYLSRPLIAFIHPDDRRMVAKRYFQQINDIGVSDIFAFRLIGKSGGIKWVEVGTAPIIWEGRPASLNFMHDVTDRKRLEEEQQRVARLESVGLLAGGIAHDFNNILTAILGNITLAGMEAAPGSELQNSLEQAEKASLRAKDLTRQLLTFSKGGAPVLKLASLTELLRDTAVFALRGSNVKCRFSIPAGLWHAEIDAGQISQVIHNLVINAQQAMPTGGTIVINAENMALGGTQRLSKGLPLKAGDYIRIAVVDHGTGIPADHLEKIFDPFFSTKQKGSGLGLATSFSIAHQHGGHISVESAPGAGSTFYLYLPASTQIVTPEPAKKEATKAVGNARILVMDDEQGVRDIAGRLLQHIGYQDVVFASDGAGAIKLYKASMKSGRPFTLAILDLTIAGGMGGKETIRKLLKIDPGVKAIVSSGYADDPVIAKYRDYGFSGMVAKPYTIEELRKALQDVIGGD